MAKTGVFGSDPAVMAKATELKREIGRLVKTIVDDEDCNTDKLDQAITKLSALKEMTIKKGSSSLSSLEECCDATCPEQYKCPLSKEMMRDPVVVASGQTYDRPFIQKWLKEGNRTCPQTHQVLSHTLLTRNHLVREMISQWCKNHGVELLDPVRYVNEEGVTNDERQYFQSLLDKFVSYSDGQKEAAKELRSLTKSKPSYRVLFGEFSDAIPLLLSPLCKGGVENAIDSELQEDIITTLLNLSIHDKNKKLAAETDIVIPLLMESLESGSIETRTNAAATIFSLAALDSNKALIGKSGALKPLINLLNEGDPLASKDAAEAIYTLCINHDNKIRALREGAVRVILDKIKEDVFVDELLTILARLSTNQKAVEEMGDLGAVPCLLRTIRESSREHIKENAIAVIYAICINDRTKCKDVREDENIHGTVSKLTQDGTPRAKRKAQGVLDRLDKAIHFTYTA